MNPEYNITREDAARILKMNVRTVDRYMARGKLKNYKKKGRVWLSENEVRKLHKENESNSLFDSLNEDSAVWEKVEESPIIKSDIETVKYKRLFKKARRKLKMAILKISSLEQELSKLLPQTKLLNESLDSVKREKVNLEKKYLADIHEKEVILKEKDEEIESEKFNKGIIAAVLFFILFLQPILWMILK